MSEDGREEIDITEVESALRSLSPKRSHIDRDRLMYLAGQASVRESSSVNPRWPRLVWPSATAAMTLVAATLGLLLWQTRNAMPVMVERAHGVHSFENNPAVNPMSKSKPDHERVAVVPGDSPSVNAESSVTSDVRLLARISTHGINPYAEYATQPSKAPSNAVERPRSQREILDNLLDQPAPPRSIPSYFLLDLY